MTGQMGGQSQTSGTGDDRVQDQLSQLFPGPCQEKSQGFLDVGVVSLIVGKQHMVLAVGDCYFYSGGTDIDP